MEKNRLKVWKLSKVKNSILFKINIVNTNKIIQAIFTTTKLNSTTTQYIKYKYYFKIS